MKLTLDRWEGGNHEAESIIEPSWADVERAIRALDQRERTAVILRRPTGDELLIGGGAGSFSVSINTPDDQTLVVVTPGAEKVLKPLVAGGVEGLFEGDELVSVDAAIAAAQAFYDSGERSPHLHWR